MHVQTKSVLFLKPANISFEEAAATPVAGIVALQAINKCQPIINGMSLLINGASGGVGSFVLQLAKSYGTTITATCSTKNVGTVKSNGADEIIDYTKTDFTKQTRKYDVIIAVNGFRSIWQYKNILNKNGKYVAVGGEIKQIFQALFWGPIVSLFGNKKMMFLGISKTNSKDLETLAFLLETGKIIPRIDKTFPLSQAVEAFEYVLNKHAQGKVVLTI